MKRKAPRADKGATAIARKYIAAQFATMERHGSGHIHMSRAEYWKLVRDVCKPMIELQKWRHR